MAVKDTRSATMSTNLARSAAPLLDMRDLTTSLMVRGTLRPIVRLMSMTIAPGEIVGLVGESGSGKSITARSIMGLLPKGARNTGQILFDGRDTLSLTSRDLRTLRSDQIGMIFQDPRAHIDPLWKIEDYLGEGLRLHKGKSRGDARSISRDLLSSLGITDPSRVLSSYPGQLSGGMLQRVMIAGALSCEPKLIIADEATTALDVTVQADILAILRDLQQTRGLSMLFITHDLALASLICDKIVVMYAGRPMAVQRAGDLFDAPAHPYAAALVGARPRMDRKVDRLQAIGGRPVSALEVSDGCPFRPRCPYAIDDCADIEPVLLDVGGVVQSECIRTNDIREQMREGVHRDD